MSLFFDQEAVLKQREGLCLSLMSKNNQLEEIFLKGRNFIFQFTILLSLDHSLLLFCNLM